MKPSHILIPIIYDAPGNLWLHGEERLSPVEWFRKSIQASWYSLLSNQAPQNMYLFQRVFFPLPKYQVVLPINWSFNNLSCPNPIVFFPFRRPSNRYWGCNAYVSFATQDHILNSSYIWLILWHVCIKCVHLVFIAKLSCYCTISNYLFSSISIKLDVVRLA